MLSFIKYIYMFSMDYVNGSWAALGTASCARAPNNTTTMHNEIQPIDRDEQLHKKAIAQPFEVDIDEQIANRISPQIHRLHSKIIPDALLAGVELSSTARLRRR